MREQNKKLELSEVNNIKFTSREVDIISVILNNRGEKKIASLLAISPRTVSSHVHNIMLKTGQNSKDGIIDFIQSSGSISDFNNHYQSILIQDIFRQYLIKIKREIVKSGIDFPICKRDHQLLKIFLDDLQFVGINLIVEFESSISSFAEILESEERENYHAQLFSLIEKITGKKVIQDYHEKFREEIEAINHTSNNIDRQEEKVKYRHILYGIIALLLILAASILIFSKNENKSIVRSSLMLPHKDILVQRPALLNKLDNILSNKNQVSVAVVTGEEGTGKTVLARAYASSQNCPVIWEIDASSDNAMLSSFEKLAYFLSESKEDREELERLEKTMSIEARVKKLEYFLSKKSRKYSKWLVIYNNAPSFESIEEYFPYDAKVWGNGSVIITTRNTRIKANHFIPEKNFIRLNELTRNEKGQLFSNILKPRLVTKETAYEKLIDKLPPYPLDIFHAATFIKNNNISCEEYLSYFTTSEHLEGNADIRNQIVSRSIDQMFSNNHDFKELLILISSISNSKIPKDLLEFASSESQSSMFLEEIQKFGLLNAKNSDEEFIAIHPSVQKIALAKLKNMDFYHKASISVAKILNNYYTLPANENNMDRIQSTISHIKSFLSNSNNIHTKTFGELYMKLGNAYFDIGAYEASNKHYNNAKQIYQIFYSDLHPKIAILNERLGNLYRNMGDYDKSKTHLEKAINAYSKIYSKDSEKTGKAYLYLGSVYRSLGEIDKAYTYTTKGAKILHSMENPDPMALAKSDAYLATVYTNLAKYKPAQEMLEKTLLTYTSYYGNNHTKTAWLKTRLAKVYREVGKLDEAKKLVLDAQNIYKDYCGENSIDYAWSTANLGIIYKKIGSLDTGNKLIKNSLKIYQKHYEQNHHTIIWAKNHLAQI